MCLFTHFAAGALVGGATGHVGAAVLGGLASHVLLDALPHYDFPDWRIELAGGGLALWVLLIMPFVSWPAVVGGLCGMLPDLENLLQKLGRLKRSSFRFPSHTGLVLHGRETGPSTLMWQLLLAAGCFVGLALVTPVAAHAQPPVVSARPPADRGGQATPAPATMGLPRTKVITTDEAGSLIHVSFPVEVAPASWRDLQPERIVWVQAGLEGWDGEGQAFTRPPQHRFNLAIPRDQVTSWRVQQIRWWREPAAPVDPRDLVAVSAPGICRDVPLVTVSVTPLSDGGGVVASLTVQIDHPATQRYADYLRAGESTKLMERKQPDVATTLVVNPVLFQRLHNGARAARAQLHDNRSTGYRGRQAKNVPDNPFGATDHWLRLEVEQTGIYRLDGYSLSTLGIPTSAVDPQKLRLYKGGGLPLDPNPELPEEQQLERVRLHEVSILVRDGGDGWDSDDDLLFYGFGGDVWLDRLDPAEVRPLIHFEHPYDRQGVYWLTWEDFATSSPLPGTPRRVVPVSAPSLGGEVVQIHQARWHLEESGVDWLGQLADNWAWDISITNNKVISFDLPPVVPGSETLFVMDIRSVVQRDTPSTYLNQATAWLNDDLAHAVTQNWTVGDQYPDSLRIRLVGISQTAAGGTNRLTLRNDNGAPRLSLALDSVDLLAWSPLVKGSDQMQVVHWGHQVSAPGTAVDLTLQVPGPDVQVWDVSVADSALALTGTLTESQTLTLGLVRDPDANRHLIVFTDADLLEPSARSTFDYRPIPLRSRAQPADYVVIYDSRFRSAADMLVDLRSTNLPGFSSPTAVAFDEEDIYDNFSGGLKDPYALRNFLRWLTLERPGDGDPVPYYVCWLGDASRDYRNNQNHDPVTQLYDFLPTGIRTYFPRYPRTGYTYDPYATDDELVSFDVPPGTNPLDIPDLVSGRLTVVKANEALATVQRISDYDNAAEPGLWRNRIVYSADDLYTPRFQESGGHIRQAEACVNHFVPASIDVQKVYLTEYEKPPGSSNKPGARLDARNLLRQGTTIFHYVGHGSNAALADEQVLLLEDVYSLDNGRRRGLFTAFSCDVGIYESPVTQSMAEIFVSQPLGGAIVAICASQVSWSTYNDRLAFAFYNNLYPHRHAHPTRTLGEALWAAKVDIGDTLGQYLSFMQNAQRYILFGDPAVHLPIPVSGIDFAPASPDSLRGGALETVVVDLAGQGLPDGLGVSYDLRVEEARHHTSASNDYWTVHYWLPGAAVFRGTGEVEDQTLRIPFKVPTQLRYGPDAKIRLVLSAAEGEWAGADSLSIVTADIGTPDDVMGPDIALAFEDNRYRVRTGTQLQAALQDTSGISILGTNPSNSVLLEFDDTGFMINVSESFAFQSGSYTTGQLALPLPGDLPYGTHKASLHASDVLGNVGSDTLSFLLVAESVAGIADVTVFPNPTPGPCRLVFELSDPMLIEWDIFTLAGRRIKQLRQDFGTAGPKVMTWDGRDQAGDAIANGVYLYVLRGRLTDSEVRDIKQTGQLVIMK